MPPPPPYMEELTYGFRIPAVVTLVVPAGEYDVDDGVVVAVAVECGS
jgi:hypothetical protein